MKTLRVLYNNNINNFFYSRIKETNILKTFVIYKYIYNNRLYYLDKNIKLDNS